MVIQEWEECLVVEDYMGVEEFLVCYSNIINFAPCMTFPQYDRITPLLATLDGDPPPSPRHRS